jgi:hypothetical protein
MSSGIHSGIVLDGRQFFDVLLQLVLGRHV